jgi:putative ABC transport system permease protein
MNDLTDFHNVIYGNKDTTAVNACYQISKKLKPAVLMDFFLVGIFPGPGLLSLNQPAMFKRYLISACRSFLHKKGFTILNIAGLTLGISLCGLIFFYVIDELSFDRFNAQADRIFRVNTDTKWGSTASSRAISSPGIAGALQENFPEILRTVRLLPVATTIKKGAEYITEPRAAYCDSTIFDVFTLPMIEGKPGTALTAPKSVVLSESAAKKYFNSTHIVGQTLAIIDEHNHPGIRVVTGVIRDIPDESHFHFDLLFSMSSVRISYKRQLNALFPFTTYLLLRPGADYNKLQSKFPAFMRKNLPFLDDMEKQGDYIRINLTPLTDIHLRSNRTDELGTNGSIQYIHVFFWIAIFILCIACINFMNLSTASASARAKEIGVRKILGAPRKALVVQFLVESLVLTSVAMVLAILAAWISLHWFNQLLEKKLALTIGSIGWIIGYSVVVTGLVGLVAGLYPSFVLSSFRPADVLKGN